MRVDHKKEFQKCLRSIDYSRNDYEVFSDFLTLASLSIANAFYKDEKLEKEYLEIIGRYKKNQDKFSKLLAIVVNALEENPYQDFMGELYMSLEFGNKHTGQFFTPYHVSQMMAQITVDKNSIEEQIKKEGFLTLNEPCNGAGGMIIAYAHALHEVGINPQQSFYFLATDIDRKCFEMTYIQTSLLGLCGAVEWGNTLSLESFRVYNTPIWFTSEWQTKFRINKIFNIFKLLETESEQEKQEVTSEEKPNLISVTEFNPPKIKSKEGQLSLFS